MSLEIKSGTFNGRQGLTIGPVCLQRGKLEIADQISGANAVQSWFTASLTTGPGSNGWRLNRASADNTPLSLAFQTDLAVNWELGLDATTNDLALYCGTLTGDLLRARSDTGQTQIGAPAARPAASDPQLLVVGGSSGTPIDALTATVYGSAHANLALRRGEASPADKRTLLIWYKAGGGAGWQMLTDSALNGTCDWVMQNVATGNVCFSIGTGDTVTVGSTNAGSSTLLQSPITQLKGTHLTGNGGPAPTIAAGANAGTAPPPPVVTAGATDIRGNFTFGTGTSAAAGAMATITYNVAYASAPFVMVEPKNALSAQFLAYVTSLAGSFTLNFQAAPTSSQGAAAYSFDYWVIG